MANCKYEINIDGNILRFNSDKELTEYILSNKIKSSTSIKYSLDLTDRQNVVSLAIKENVSDGAYNNSKGLSYNKFLEIEHIVDGKPKLLVPKFDSENYIKNKVAEEISKLLNNKSISDDQVEDTSKILYKEIEQDLSEDNIMRKAGIDIHSVVFTALQTGINSKNTNTDILKFIDNLDKFNNITRTESEKELLLNKVKSELKKSLNFIYSLGESVLVRPKILTKGTLLKDTPDIVVIDSKGNPHIIDLTLSRKPILN